ncbi:Disease resistance RPP13-like protein 4 [Camellia lanceoleosa]|uniref:Disease resistance RPP13-like protein 4 n=1 Tax=Camellia lanceoleosa TaxID=1840588 RepID=A0ACC0GR98_9ERIC|nr:Disease resistance RPP13-like protein 4 [Camellia lanceoleosa]
MRILPSTITPNWLRACNLKNLKKLYIRGGQLSDLGQKLDDKKAEKDKWKVEILCLKYLGDLEMNWSDLQGLFPKLKFSEMVNCPKLIGFQIDNSQVSMNSVEFS